MALTLKKGGSKKCPLRFQPLLHVRLLVSSKTKTKVSPSAWEEIEAHHLRRVQDPGIVRVELHEELRELVDAGTVGRHLQPRGGGVGLKLWAPG